MIKLFRYFLLLISAFISLQMFSQTSQEEIKFEHLNMKDGLSMNPVMTIIQDKYGFLWFGTQDGLNRYNGYNFTVFKNQEEDPKSITDNFITSTAIDKNKNLWIGTLNGGLNRFDYSNGKFNRFQQYDRQLNNIHIWCMYMGVGPTLWIGTDKGVQLFDTDKKIYLDVYKLHPELSVLDKNSVLSIRQDKDRAWWVGTTDGLYFFDFNKKQTRHYAFKEGDKKSLSNNIVLSIFQDSKGAIWAGTLEGLNKLNKDESFTHYYFKQMQHSSLDDDKGIQSQGEKIYSIVNNYGGNTIRCIMEDAKGELWIGTDMELIIFNPATGKYINYKKDLINPNGINDHFIRSMFVDHSGNLWIGTLGNGLNKVNLNPKKFKLYQKKINNPLSLSENYVRAIAEDPKGRIWIGTLIGGLNRFDKEKDAFYHYTQTKVNSPSSINDNNVWSLCVDKKEDGLWIGTNSGVDFLDFETEKFTHYTHTSKDPNSISDNTIRCMLLDSKNNLWVGTENGLNKFDREKKIFKYYNKQNSALSDNTVWKIVEDKAGMLWLATNFGLDKFDPDKETFVVYKKQSGDTNSLSYNACRTLFIDSKGILWVGTQNGLNAFDSDKQSFKRYNETDGLPNPFIYAIVEDDNKNLWITTNKGVSELVTTQKRFINYDIYDGLQDYEFNTNAIYKATSGDIYIGGPSGLNVFNPEQLLNKPYNPPVVLTDVKVMDKSFAADTSLTELKELTLNYNQNVVRFEFSSLDYSNPARNQYAYQMEGFDEDWIYSGSIRFISYTNLDPGDYKFKVKGTNSDGVWSNNICEIKVTVLPPFWRTWWFYTLCTIAGIIGIVVFIRKRTQALVHQKQVLESMVKTRTVEVESQKNLLAQKNKDITDSLTYAKRIQQGILPEEKTFQESFPESFVIYKPRDIVSGDLYWLATVKTSGVNTLNLKIIAVADCTGHGVPGAFMSIIVSELLNQTIKHPEINSPAEVLNFLNKQVPMALNRNSTEKINDGLDIVIIAIDVDNKRLYYSGANRPLWILRKNESFEAIVPNKAAIGGYTAPDYFFDNHQITLETGDCLYMFSDGYADQFGGRDGKKMGSKSFRELLIKNYHLPMSKQKQQLEYFYNSWKGNEEQVDDVCVIGLRIG